MPDLDIGVPDEGVDRAPDGHRFAGGTSARAHHGAIGRPAEAGGGTVAGRYRLSMLLGTGGMGAVWLAEDAVLLRAVALKRLTDQLHEDGPCALREARAAACITHPGVVRVYDVVVDRGDDWIVMEALPGEPLSTVIRERGRLPVDEVVQIGLQLLSALQAIHDADLLHRDIKPSNIQVCGGNRIVITDFGLSSPSTVSDGPRAGAIAGSLPYMAPETLRDGILGPPSDLYALGVTLYTAVEGRPPFDPGELPSLMNAVLSAPPKPARHAGALSEVLHGLLDKDPERRLNAAQARAQLQALSLVSA